jgi:FkbM family methyltransferase
MNIYVTKDAIPDRNAIEAEVRALYRSILLREPDIVGFDSYVSLIESGSAGFSDVVDAMLRSEEFAWRAGAFTAAYAPKRFFNEVSQFGEVSLLLRRLIEAGTRHQMLVDVGARGRRGSNSYDLLRWFGWKGILIDANPALTLEISSEFSGLDVELVTCAISDVTGKGTLHIGINDDISSLSSACTQSWGPVGRTIEVPVRRLRDVLDERRVPVNFDLLSIDAEGEDWKILNDTIVNSFYRPNWIIIEASCDGHTKSLDDIPVADKIKWDYQLIDSTPANFILRLIS